MSDKLHQTSITSFLGPGKNGNKRAREDEKKRETPNLDFHRNLRLCSPDNMKIDDIHKEYRPRADGRDEGGWDGNFQVLEAKHGYIQWLFPIKEPGVNRRAFEMQPEEAEAIKTTPELRRRVLKSYQMMLRFWGMEMMDPTGGSGALRRCADKDAKARLRHVRTWTGFHNLRRMTRVMKNFNLTGWEHLQAGFIKFFVCEMYAEDGALKRTNFRDRVFPDFVEAVFQFFLPAASNLENEAEKHRKHRGRALALWMFDAFPDSKDDFVETVMVSKDDMKIPRTAEQRERVDDETLIELAHIRKIQVGGIVGLQSLPGWELSRREKELKDKGKLEGPSPFETANPLIIFQKEGKQKKLKEKEKVEEKAKGEEELQNPRGKQERPGSHSDSQSSLPFPSDQASDSEENESSQLDGVGKVQGGASLTGQKGGEGVQQQADSTRRSAMYDGATRDSDSATLEPAPKERRTGSPDGYSAHISTAGLATANGMAIAKTDAKTFE
uniref:Opioid growth factor receptor (OGFr) conserved domain-containing protein n=1 Tax=Chromera velia CCMP2878 TaxID=1169474 RepID=A0A0G4HMB8_9ALVE|eukprot:Cvel_7479.t1-p1 / transcript=Cvel_7479.t1 / gene=Cvel_7479 / organism=Chromera_velia_CCMP2878 / gene_product=Opioid growth factor receptor, putative / transcript_product=Opioid growth factor receptor, putative / location=Cvel_scaffold392:5298-9221(-) / protein_length=496 / sequence_SO=supercontig / SO=protein_coding / is_pseudo=false